MYYVDFLRFSVIKWKLYFVNKTRRNLGDVIENNTTIRKPILYEPEQNSICLHVFLYNKLRFVCEREAYVPDGSSAQQFDIINILHGFPSFKQC